VVAAKVRAVESTTAWLEPVVIVAARLATARVSLNEHLEAKAILPASKMLLIFPDAALARAPMFKP
jgi:hypothetical protein